MNRQELRERRRAIIHPYMYDGYGPVEPDEIAILDQLDALDAEYARSKERPIAYAFVARNNELMHAILSAPTSRDELLGITDTVMAACVKFRETLLMDETIAQFKAMDVSAFVSGEDAK